MTDAMQRLAPSRAFAWGLRARAQMAGETVDALRGPGTTLNMFGSRDYAAFRSRHDRDAAVVGVTAGARGHVAVVDVPNPDRADGRWDPRTFMPNFVFDRAEDAFPVAPAFDGNATLGDNGPSRADGPAGHYRDGRVGGPQALSASFHVSRKAGYVVLTYSFYLAHNKGGHYHPNDYATAQVYLKPGPGGRLAPAYLFSSWHRGGVMTPWQNLATDAAGRPTLRVSLGTHAMFAAGRDDRFQADGLMLRGDGQASFAGRPLAQRLGFEAFQGNVDGATRLVPGTAAYRAREKVQAWGGGALDPYLPESFAGRGFWHEVWGKARAKARDVADDTWQAVKGLWP